jgi:CO/xanthine dehydrogenase FAD-binding subunit
VNLNTITEVRRVTRNGVEDFDWREGDSWLAGGTWLFSEPQPHLRRLLDLQGFDWEPLVVSEQGLQISPICTIAQLYALEAPPEWAAAPLIHQCCKSFLASFKVWNTATVGGNICMSLTVALEGIYTIRLRDGSERRVAAEEFVTGNNQNILQPGDLLRSIDLPITALQKRTSFRRMSLTHLGRSTALLIGTLSPQDGTFMLTVSASTKRPMRLSFDRVPDARSLHERLRETIADSMYHDDVHGAPVYRKHLTFHFAEEIRGELSSNQAA